MDKVDIKSYSEEHPKPRLWGPITSIIIALAALAAAVISGVTLKHMKDQLEVSTKPQIIIIDSRIGINMDPPQYVGSFRKLITYTHNGKPDLDLIYSQGEMKLNPTRNLNLFKLNIVNIGLGPAKDLKFTWRTDAIAWNDLFHRAGIPLFKALDFESDRIDTCKVLFNKFLDSAMHNLDTVTYRNMYCTEGLNYLLPQNNNPEPVFISIPKNYVTLHCLYKIYSKDVLGAVPIPPLLLRIW